MSDYVTQILSPKTTWQRMKRTVGISIATIIVLGIVVNGLLPGLDAYRDGNPLKCSSNLRQIGLAMKMYANQFDNLFPSDFRGILLTQDITADVFVCPSSKTDRWISTQTKQAAADGVMNPTGHHCSYIYAGNGLRDDTIGADDVLAFEAQPNLGLTRHHYCVLFGDGHADTFYPPDKLSASESLQYQHLIADFATGVQPLRLRP